MVTAWPIQPPGQDSPAAIVSLRALSASPSLPPVHWQAQTPTRNITTSSAANASSPNRGNSQACIGSANSVPNVPGASGISPMPKPNAMMCAGCENTQRPDGLPAMSAEMVKPLVLYRQRPALGIEYGNRITLDDPADARQGDVQHRGKGFDPACALRRSGEA